MEKKYKITYLSSHLDGFIFLNDFYCIYLKLDLAPHNRKKQQPRNIKKKATQKYQWPKQKG